MKLVTVVALLPFVSFARPVAVPTLPVSEYADTESVTNLSLDVSREDIGRLDVVLAANATPSNNVQVAFGVDANRNGALEPAETETVIGWDCGAWFVRDERAEWSRRWTRAAGSRELVAFLRVRSRRARSIVLSDGEGLFNGRTPEIPATLFNPAWDMVRVTSRGHALREETVAVRPQCIGLVLEVR